MKASEAQPVEDHKGGNILRWNARQARPPTSLAARSRDHSQGTDSINSRVDTAILGTESPDARLDMSFWCERLNRMPGLFTVHSSPGHRSIEGHLLSGHLWITLDKELEKQFTRMVFDLSREIRYVERVSRIYTSWGQQIIEIVFAGSERGLLQESMELIIGFFELLTEMSLQDSR